MRTTHLSEYKSRPAGPRARGGERGGQVMATSPEGGAFRSKNDRRPGTLANDGAAEQNTRPLWAGILDRLAPYGACVPFYGRRKPFAGGLLPGRRSSQGAIMSDGGCGSVSDPRPAARPPCGDRSRLCREPSCDSPLFSAAVGGMC
jgi:hypothetical protein